MLLELIIHTATRHWSRSFPPGQKPAGRYGHTLNILGSKIYVFGGQVEGYFFNDLWAFDLNALQNAHSKWEMITQNSLDGGPPEGQIPPARTNHTTVTWNEKLYLYVYRPAPFTSTDQVADLEAPMALNGSMTSGPTILGSLHGRSWIVLATYLLLGKDTLLPWSTMLCIYLVDGQKTGPISAI